MQLTKQDIMMSMGKKETRPLITKKENAISRKIEKKTSRLG